MNSAIFKVKIKLYDVTMVYLPPIILHFWLSNHFNIFRKCSRMGINSNMFKVKISKYDVAMVYLLPIIIHFWLSNHFKIFRKLTKWIPPYLKWKWANMMWPWCTCYPLLYTSGCQITSTFSENVLGWLYYLFSENFFFIFSKNLK